MINDLPTRLRNLRALLTGGIRPDVRTPSVTLFDDEHRGLRRYADDATRSAAAAAGGTPVLLIPPIAAPATCYDLSPEFSVVAHLAETGRVPYVVDFGEMGYADRHLGFEDFVLDIIPQAISRVVQDFWPDGADGAAGTVDLLSWSLGGIMSLLTAAASPQPIRSVTAVASPLDYNKLAGYPELRALNRPTGGKLPSLALGLLGGVPAPLVQVGYRLTSWDRELKKPLFILQNLENTDTLIRMEVINRFQRTFPGYPGRVAQQIWERFAYRGELGAGVVHLGDVTVDLSRVDVPVQLFGSHRDALCTWGSARHGFETLTGSPRIEFATVESSHLGLLAGPDAVRETWPVIDGFLSSLDTTADLTT